MAGAGEPEEGLISAADLPDEWQEAPADGVADFAATTESAAAICEELTALAADVADASSVDRPTFTLDGQEFSSYVLDLGTKPAKRVITTFKDCGSKSPVGKNSVGWSEPVFEQSADGDLTVISDLRFVLVRVGPMLGV